MDLWVPLKNVNLGRYSPTIMQMCNVMKKVICMSEADKEFVFGKKNFEKIQKKFFGLKN